MPNPMTAIECELWRVRIPLARAIGTPGRSFSFTHLLFAVARDASGNAGIGYSRFFDPADLDPALAEARSLLAQAPHLAALLDIERVEASREPEPRVPSRSAANALSMAAWDLAGRRRGMACADLWGRPPGRERVACYASALFLHTPLDELAAEARDYRSRGYPQVKMRVAPTVEETNARIEAVRSVYREPATIALEAALSWTPELANTFLRSTTVDLAWLEDPVQYSRMVDVEPGGRRVAAGEVLESTRDLVALYATGRVSHVILDVQAMGGPIRFVGSPGTELEFAL